MSLESEWLKMGGFKNVFSFSFNVCSISNCGCDHVSTPRLPVAATRFSRKNGAFREWTLSSVSSVSRVFTVSGSFRETMFALIENTDHMRISVALSIVTRNSRPFVHPLQSFKLRTRDQTLSKVPPFFRRAPGISETPCNCNSKVPLVAAFSSAAYRCAICVSKADTKGTLLRFQVS